MLSDFIFSNYLDASCPYNFILNLTSLRNYYISKLQVTCKIKKEVKAYKVKQRKIQGESRVKGRKPGLKSMIWNKREK